jgi:hypothetical protein
MLSHVQPNMHALRESEAKCPVRDRRHFRTVMFYALAIRTPPEQWAEALATANRIIGGTVNEYRVLGAEGTEVLEHA